MKRKILITGISGFIGKHLAEYLRKKFKIIGIDREPPGVIHQDIEFYQQDINDEPMFKDKVYAVIHLAAKAGVRESQEKFDEYVHDNILGTKAVLDNCIKYWKPRRIYIASSSSIYGDSIIDNEYHPKSLYAMSKVATEQIAEAYRNSLLLPGIISCLRLFTVYGPKQRKGLAFREFIDKILRDEPITVYGDGTQLRDFTYIDDLCNSIEGLLEAKLILFRRDIGSSNPVTLNSVIHLLSKITGKDITIHYEDWDRYDVFKTCSHVSSFDRPTPLEVGLRKQVEWQKKILK